MRNKIKRVDWFISMPTEVLNHKKLSNNAKLLYGFIFEAAYFGEGNMRYFNISNKELSKKMGFKVNSKKPSYSSVERLLKELRDNKVIENVENSRVMHKGNHSTYRKMKIVMLPGGVR